MTTDFHKAPKAWSQIKHQILGGYLSLFLGKLGSNNTVYYIDGFAGSGRLDDGTNGSPLVAARLAVNTVQERRKGNLRCINVEKKEDTFTKLEQATAPYVDRGLVKNYHGEFEELLPSILEEIGDNTAFFFIDPFGTQGAEVRTLKSIAGRRGKFEALVRYDDTRVKRLIMWAAKNEDSLNPAHRKTAKRLKDRVKELSDEEATQQAERELLFRAETETRDLLIEGYKNRVKERTNFRYALHYPIKNPTTSGHRYFLVHFCSHPDGFTHMANFMARAERTYRKLVAESSDLFDKRQLEFMPLNRELADKEEQDVVQAIYNELPDIVSENGWNGKVLQNREIYAAIVDRLSWKVLRKEYVKALRQLEKAGKVHIDGTKDYERTTIKSR